MCRKGGKDMIKILKKSNVPALLTETTKDWAGNWFKIIGGKGDVKVSFVSNNSGNNFVIPYIIQKNNGSYIIKFLNLIK